MNRQMRRAGQAVHRTNVRAAFKADLWGEWEDLTLEIYLKLADKPERNRLKKYYKNNIYTAQIIETENANLLGIRRHDQLTDIPWSHKQRIKNEVFWEGVQAIEIFPPEADLVDGANMYWLWVLNDEIKNCNLNDALRGIYSS